MATYGKVRYFISGIAVGFLVAGLISAMGMFPNYFWNHDNLIYTIELFAISGILSAIKIAIDSCWDY